MFQFVLENNKQYQPFDEEPNISPICNSYIVAKPLCSISNVD